MRNKFLNNNIWIEQKGKANFEAFLALRNEVIRSYDACLNHKTRKESLRALKKEIKDEIKWLEAQIEKIDGELYG